MRYAVVYSSRTGNTKMVAEAIHAVLPEGAAIYPLAEAPAPEEFDFLALGFWADKGKPDTDMLGYMEKVAGKGIRVGLFGTLGAYPESDHGKEFMQRAADAVSGNELVCSFACMGKVDPKLLEAMEQMRKKGVDVHPMTPERAARIAKAARHPNEEDLKNAARVFCEALSGDAE